MQEKPMLERNELFIKKIICCNFISIWSKIEKWYPNHFVMVNPFNIRKNSFKSIFEYEPAIMQCLITLHYIEVDCYYGPIYHGSQNKWDYMNAVIDSLTTYWEGGPQPGGLVVPV